MPKGLKITNRANHVIFDSALIAGVDYDKEEFSDDDYEEDQEEHHDEPEEEYDEMDPNELADILQETNEFHTPHESEEEHEIVFQDVPPEEAEELRQETLFEDYEDRYEDGEDDNEFQEEIPIEVDDIDGEEEANQGDRRSGRVRVRPARYQHLNARADQTKEYGEEDAHIYAKTMLHYNTAMAGMNEEKACSFLQTYSLKQGIRKFGEKGRAAAKKELGQLHGRVVFEPISIEDMTALEKKRAMESLIFLNEKRDETIKARMCANGSTQRSYISREEASSPTAASEAIITTGVIDAKERRDIMTLDIPNAFVQTKIDF
jgi:hypothetical protein